MFELKNIKKKYSGKTILDQVSLTMKPGDISILLGHSGVGKSTLLRVICNLEEFEEGQIFLNEQSFSCSSLMKKHEIGMVFQSYHLFDHLTVLENLTTPLILCLKKSKSEAKAIALDLLEKYNLFEKADVYPCQISGGQKQRLAIARAVVMEPSVLCMDEPTSALDPKSTSEVADQIIDLSKKGYILLIATHDTSLLEKMDCTVYLMESGKIVESANSSRFQENRSLYPALNDYLLGKR